MDATETRTARGTPSRPRARVAVRRVSLLALIEELGAEARNEAELVAALADVLERGRAHMGTCPVRVERRGRAARGLLHAAEPQACAA